METVGRRHAVVKRTRELVRERSRRDEDGLFVAEGIHLAEEALAAKVAIESALLSPRLFATDRGRQIARRLERGGVALFEIADTVMETVCDARAPQPVLIVVRRNTTDLTAALDRRPGVPLVVVTHALQDPGNLGTILRTSDAAGATCLVSAGNGVDLFHPKTVRATMGSIFRLPACHGKTDQTLETLRHRKIVTVGADRSATDSYVSSDLTVPVSLVFGREATGLSDELLASLDRHVRIPMSEGVESLSVGAAAAVLLFEAARQRRS